MKYSQIHIRMKHLLSFFFILILSACSSHNFKSKWTHEKAPEKFLVRFETDKGNFDTEISRALSPQAVDRFYQQVKHHYYDDAVFYRVIPGFVAQFGTSDTVRTNQWAAFKVPDEPVMMGNEKGTLSFARAGKETRGSDLYFNLVTNNRLDTVNYNDVKGFPAFGKIVSGHSILDSIYSGYGPRSVDQLDTFYINRTKYLSAFPKLAVIRKLALVKP